MILLVNWCQKLIFYVRWPTHTQLSVLYKIVQNHQAMVAEWSKSHLSNSSRKSIRSQVQIPARDYDKYSTTWVVTREILMRQIIHHLPRACMLVLYFDQHLGAVHSKRWSKYRKEGEESSIWASKEILKFWMDIIQFVNRAVARQNWARGENFV